MDAKITVEFIAKNICDFKDLIIYNMNFDEMVQMCIKEESLLGIVEDPQGKVIKIEQI